MNNGISINVNGNNGVNVTIPKQNGITLGMGDPKGAVPSYKVLPDKPQINGHTLVENKTADELDLEHKLNVITEQQIDNLFFGGGN